MEFPIINDIEQVKKDYPKSMSKMKEFLQKLTNAEFEEVDMLIDLVLSSDPRKLYDFFDQNDIRISISYNKETKMFTYVNDQLMQSSVSNDRATAEVKAFEEAFKTLEAML